MAWLGERQGEPGPIRDDGVEGVATPHELDRTMETLRTRFEAPQAPPDGGRNAQHQAVASDCGEGDETRR